jgi:hypothetical protein
MTLARHLHYCSGLFALVSKTAARLIVTTRVCVHLLDWPAGPFMRQLVSLSTASAAIQGLGYPVSTMRATTAFRLLNGHSHCFVAQEHTAPLAYAQTIMCPFATYMQLASRAPHILHAVRCTECPYKLGTTAQRWWGPCVGLLFPLHALSLTRISCMALSWGL